MANYMNISGTTKGSFAIGATGPIIERNGTAFNFKTSKAATALADVSVAKLTSSNVVASAITTSGKILPSKTGTLDIGSSSLKFANVYANSFQGALKGNADTATTADTAKGYTSDGAIANEFKKVLYLTGGTMTGTLIAPYIQTGASSSAYFQSQKFRGQGDAGIYYHAIDFGYNNHNQVDFYEFGGIWNFWKNTAATATADSANLALSIQLGQLVERSYTLKFPGKSGTFALTDDVSAVQTGIEDGTIVAKKATQDGNGNVISSTYHTTSDFSTFKSSLGSLAYQSALTAAQVNAVGDITNNTSGKAGSATYSAYLGDSKSNYTYSTLSTALSGKIASTDATVEATASKIVKRSASGGIYAKDGDFNGNIVIQKSASATEASNTLTIYQGPSTSANKASFGLGATGHLVESLTTSKVTNPRIAFEITAAAQSGSPTATAYVENNSGKSLLYADKINSLAYTVNGTDLYSTNSSGYVSAIAGKSIASAYDKNGKDISSEYVHKSGTWASGRVLVSNGTSSAAVSTIEVSGNDVTIKGNLHLGGSTDQVDVENLSVTDKIITLNNGASASLASNDGSGLLISKYDGTNFGALAFDKNGDILAGTLAPATGATEVTSIDTSKLRKLMMRPSSDLADGSITMWDNTNKTVAATGMTRSGTTVTVTDAIKMTNHISPTADGKYDLGSSTNRFKTVYAASFSGTATDSDKLDGNDATYFATASDMADAKTSISTLQGYFDGSKAKSAKSADSATTATNLANAPSLASATSNTQITVTAGGKTSAAFTVPYATSAGSAGSATTATNYAAGGNIDTALKSKISTSGGTINSGSLTISVANGLNYSGIGAGTANADRVVWFADNTSNGIPVYDDDFKYNPATNTLTVSNVKGTATTATNLTALSNNDSAANDHIKFTIGDKSFEKTVNNVANATTSNYFLKTTTTTDSSGNSTTTTSKSANTIQNEFGSVLYKSGGTMTGNIYFNDTIPSAITSTTPRGIYATNGTNDGWRVVGVGTSSNAGALEIATCDDGNEPIYVRQYNGGGGGLGFNSIARTATLLDGSGNTSFPGTVSATKFSGNLEGTVTGNVAGNADTSTQFSSDATVALTGDVTGTASSAKGWSVATTIADGKITAAKLGNVISTGSSTADGMTVTLSQDSNLGGLKIGLSGTATTAGTATNLANAPSLAAGTSDSNKITVAAGGKTSSEFTVPYATKANKDSDGNVITAKYVTKDTEQTISGKKTFTGGVSATSFGQSNSGKDYVDLITGTGANYGLKGSNGVVYDLSSFAAASSYVKKSGDSMSGALTFTSTSAIKYQGSKATYDMIRFIDNESDAYGNGISIGGGGAVIIGSGESASALQTANSITGGTESTYIASDGNVYFYTSCNSIANKQESYISGGVYYGNVTGDLSGNAATATYSSNFGTIASHVSYDLTTNNTTDTWVPVMSNGVLQHRVIPTDYNSAPSTLSVNYANSAGSADKATNDENGKSISATYATKTELSTGLSGKSDTDHTHAEYLQKSGDTMTGALTLSGESGTTAAGSVTKILFNPEAGTLQQGYLWYSDYDSYQAPAALTFGGAQGGEYFIAPNIKATSDIYEGTSKLSDKYQAKGNYVTTDTDQAVSGRKTFSGGIDVSASDGFKFSGIQAASVNKARPIWFAYSDGSGNVTNGIPTYDSEFTFNPNTNTLSVTAISENGTSLSNKYAPISHVSDTTNPHKVSKSQVGLGNVVNTGDSATPTSGGLTKFTTGGAYTELAKKVDKLNTLASGTDLNDVQTSGFYRLNSSHTNSPGSDCGYGQMLVIYGGSDTIAQLVFPYSSSKVYVRNGNAVGNASGAWTGWTTLANTGDLGSYLKLSGGTLTGALTILNDQYYTASQYGVNMRNSDIINLNSLYTGDVADNTSEGIHFFRSSGKYDTLTANGGTLYFMPNDPLAGSAFSSAYKVITSNDVTTAAPGSLKATLLAY